MPFAWFVALRYLLAEKGQTVLILGAVSIGVSVIVFLSALIDSLQVSLIDKTLGSQAHITVLEPRERPHPIVQASGETGIARAIQPAPQRIRSIDQWPAVLHQVEHRSGIIAASPIVTGAGFAIRSDAKNPVLVRGVVPESFSSIMDISKKILSGRFDVTGGFVVIGATLADDLGASVGDTIRITSSMGVDDVVTISGIFSLGNQAVDESWMITSLRHAQSLFSLPGGATAIEIKVADVFLAEAIAADLRNQTGLDADSWMEINAELLSGLTAQSRSKNMIEFFVVVAVALGIASVLIVSVVQKEGEIGILRAVGTPARRILAVFLIQGGTLGVLGSFVGSVLGILFARFFEGIALGPDGRPQFSIILEPQLFAFATALATLVGVLAAVIPARRAARLDPAKAIRHG